MLHEVILTDHVSTQKGFAFKSAWFTDSGRPIVKVSNFSNDSVKWTELIFVPEDIALQYARYELKTGDVLIQTVGSWPNNPMSVVGKTVRVPKQVNGALLNQNAVKLVPSSTLDGSFLFYLLRDKKFGAYIVGTAQGAANQAAITLESIRAFTFALPPIEQQRRIASILSAYDDLIENNTRRIAILEEMARRLYEEWFVRFRFPGHEGVQMVESELGLVPQGWDIKKVNDIVLRLPSGVVYKQADVSPEGTVPVIDQSTSELLGFHDNLPAHQASAAAPVVIFGDHTCKMQLMVAPFSLGPNTVPFVANELAVHYVFWVVRGLIKTQEYKRHWSDLMKKSVVIAPVFIAKSFAEQVQSMAEFSEMLKRKNRNLRTTRDLLLPKLISGELDVSTLP